MYDEIYNLGDKAFNFNVYTDVNAVLKETFERVSNNLEIIYEELKKINYVFTTEIKYDWQKPLLKPDQTTEDLLFLFEKKLGKFGHIPLSLKYFYKIVGACNFCWDYETEPEIPWEVVDPFNIAPLENLLELNDMDNYEYGLDEGIIIAGDYLHKDNISGSSYSLQVTEKPSIDSILMHKCWDIPFIQYLRITFENYGFSMASECEYENLKNFCKVVKPKLKMI